MTTYQEKVIAYKEKIAKAIEGKVCFLCDDGDGTTNGVPTVPAVDMSPYGYAVCATCYNGDFDDFVRDYS